MKEKRGEVKEKRGEVKGKRGEVKEKGGEVKERQGEVKLRQFEVRERRVEGEQKTLTQTGCVFEGRGAFGYRWPSSLVITNFQIHLNLKFKFHDKIW